MGILYFAYGSNMSRERMNERNVNIIGERIAFIKGYKIVFNKKANKNGEGYANIIPSENSVAYGVLYEIDKDDIRKLDRCEGTPYHYERKRMEVNLQDGTSIECEVYIANENKIGSNLKPSQKYLNCLIIGAKEHNFPEGYIKFLKNIETIR